MRSNIQPGDLQFLTTIILGTGDSDDGAIESFMIFLVSWFLRLSIILFVSTVLEGLLSLYKHYARFSRTVIQPLYAWMPIRWWLGTVMAWGATRYFSNDRYFTFIAICFTAVCASGTRIDDLLLKVLFAPLVLMHIVCNAIFTLVEQYVQHDFYAIMIFVANAVPRIIPMVVYGIGVSLRVLHTRLLGECAQFTAIR